MRLAAAGATSVGLVREGNEDSFLVDDRLELFAVADGMGGHRAGEVASATAVEALRAAVASGRPINDAITSANEAVVEKAADDPSLEGMGTTLTAVVPSGGTHLLVGHVGDSRAYLVHDGSLRRLTEDHSLVEELVREGRLTQEQAEVHPQRAIITRALGVDTEVDVDVYTVDVGAGDRLLLCSDGLTTMVRDRDIERVAAAERDPRRAAERLVDLANDAGGEDNVTVVVVDVLEVDEAAAPDPEAMAAPGAAATPPPLPAPDTITPARAERGRPRRSRRRIVRSLLLLVVPLLLVTAFAVGAVAWYANRTYYVGTDGGEVVLYRGVPGGLPGFDPEIAERTGIELDELTEADRAALDDGEEARGSRERAERYLDALRGRTTTTTRPDRTTTSTTRRTTTTVRRTATTATPTTRA